MAFAGATSAWAHVLLQYKTPFSLAPSLVTEMVLVSFVVGNVLPTICGVSSAILIDTLDNGP